MRQGDSSCQHEIIITDTSFSIMCTMFEFDLRPTSKLLQTDFRPVNARLRSDPTGFLNGDLFVAAYMSLLFLLLSAAIGWFCANPHEILYP